MSTKGKRTKRRIADEARKLFAESGFSKITMQDICEKTELSRGGLYKHFSSTGEIFAFIIKEEQGRSLKALEEARNNGLSIEVVFTEFINSRLRYLSNKEINIDVAFHEYAASDPAGRELMAEYISFSVATLTGILEEGRIDGVFTCGNPELSAKHILWLLEGIGMHNAIIPLTEEDISEQRDEILAYVKMH
ncbi:MAG: TetR/AcrR family transcriptional regulator [Lachnospiraceae bacterium]|jgi:AcrR family transcriptional regulator